MELKDRDQLIVLMTRRNVSARHLARCAGWKSHSYMNRLLAGQVTTLKPEAAELIARRLRVPVRRLFVPKVSTNAARTVKTRRTKGAA